MVGSHIRRPSRRLLSLLFTTLALLPAAAAAPTAAQAGEGGVSASAPEAAAPPAVAPTAGVYPVRGPHEYWDGMGAGRGHDGVDVGADCGTPLVAAQAGRVSFVKYHARAGNYVVIDLKASSYDLAYMHLSEPASVKVGQIVRAGHPLGSVGDTGNASGCHLHFEVWEGPYYGGSPIDPMPFLLAWERKRPQRTS